jgi:hypothetical protein
VPLVAAHPITTIDMDATAEAELREKVLLYSLAQIGTTVSMLS